MPLALAMFMLCGCQYIGEFPAPGGVVRITSMPPSVGKSLYSNILDKLKSQGFVEYDAQPCVSFFQNTEQCPKNFKLYEGKGPYVLNVMVQMDTQDESITYQYDEFRSHSIANRAPFTPYACTILHDLNVYVASIAPKANISYPHVRRCDIPST